MFFSEQYAEENFKRGMDILFSKHDKYKALGFEIEPNIVAFYIKYKGYKISVSILNKIENKLLKHYWHFQNPQLGEFYCEVDINSDEDDFEEIIYKIINKRIKQHNDK